MLSAATLDTEAVKKAVSGTHWDFMKAVEVGLAETGLGSSFTNQEAQDRLVQSSRLLSLSCEMESKALAVRADAINLFGTTIAGVPADRLWRIIKHTFGMGVGDDPTQEIVSSGESTEGEVVAPDEFEGESVADEEADKDEGSILEPQAFPSSSTRASPRLLKRVASTSVPLAGLPPRKIAKASVKVDLSKMRIPAGQQLPSSLAGNVRMAPRKSGAKKPEDDIYTHTAFTPLTRDDSYHFGVPEEFMPKRIRGGESVYYCSFRKVKGVMCTKEIRNKATMVNHVRRYHLKVCLVCSKCTARFWSSDAWWKHQPKHAKKSPAVATSAPAVVKLEAVEGEEKTMVEDSAAEAIQLFAELGKPQESLRRSPRT
jgi:hypothetical protein